MHPAMSRTDRTDKRKRPNVFKENILWHAHTGDYSRRKRRQFVAEFGVGNCYP